LNDFAPNAEIMVCDVDPEEIRYLEARRNAHTVLADVSDVADMLLDEQESGPIVDRTDWKSACRHFASQNATEYAKAQHTPQFADLYRFMFDLNSAISKLDSANVNLSIDGGGTVVYASMQAFMPNEKVRLALAAGPAPMGTGIPHAIGLGLAYNDPTIVLVGDGSLMFNLQEIQTAKTAGINLAIFVLQNDGYTSIRSTQQQFLEGRFLGSSAEGGVEIPNLRGLASAFEVGYQKLDPRFLESELTRLLSALSGIVLVEVPLDQKQEIYPRVAFEKEAASGIQRALPLDRMHPLH
jgi:acetolactate synthase-1/2/3 large subunit